ncbi:MAG: hypothetical protein MMC33_008315 [Icmadophila ericetorum]|nr:hypothetical protein [Icmadophila ericetorum]
MASYSTPISAARFATALPALPLSSLHAKGAEIRNSIAHLQASNEQLKEFMDQGDRECKEVITENEEVVRRMQERLGLLKVEVERRGHVWDGGVERGKAEEGDLARDTEMGDGGEADDGMNGDSSAHTNGTSSTTARGHGRQGLTDEAEDDDGVHL